MDVKSPKHIVIIGDALIDIWICGHLAPCQDNCVKFIEAERVSVPGGAANAANCLRYWKSNVSLFAQAEIYRGVKTRYIAGGTVFRHDNETQQSSCSASMRRETLLAVHNADAVLLSDYDKGFLTENFVTAIVRRTKELGIPCVADAKRKPSFYDGCILKCNADYATTYSEVLVHNNSVITYGPVHPTVVANGCHVPKTPGVVSVPCINHVGAGDCFAAHLVLALAHGFSLEDAATIAHSAGRVYVQHLHNRPPRPSEIETSCQ